MGTFDVSGSVVRAMLKLRAEQDQLFGVPLGRGYAWDLILVLYLADAEGRELKGREAIYGAGTSLDVGRRWLSYLSKAGIVLGDRHGNPDVLVTLSPDAVTKVEGYVERALSGD